MFAGTSKKAVSLIKMKYEIKQDNNFFMVLIDGIEYYCALSEREAKSYICGHKQGCHVTELKIIMDNKGKLDFGGL